MNKQLSKRDYSILMANSVEHFDTALYGFLAPVMAPLFFPNEDPIVSLILAYSIFATSLVTRPLGTYIFGSIAASLGAGKSLVYSLTGVAIFTVLIGLIPTYEQIGFLAPLFLLLLRVIRDTCSSGEIAIARLYILEDKTDRMAFRSSYIYQTSTMLGIVLASLASTFIINLDLNHLWRICYICGGLASIIALYLRQFGDEVITASKRKLLKSFTVNLTEEIWTNRVALIRIALVFSFSYITYSTAFILLNTLIPLISNHSLATMMNISTTLLVIDLLCLPIIGRLIESYQAKKIMILAASVLAFTSVPLWYFLANAPLWYVFFVRAWFVFWGVMFTCPINLWCSKQILSDYKYTITGLAESLGVGTIGKLNPAICLYIFHQTGTHFYIALYLFTIFILTAIFMKKGKP